MMNEKTKKRIGVPIWIVDGICIAYFLCFVSWIFLWSDTGVGKLMIASIKYFNPFTAGVYVVGLATIATLLFLGKNWIKIVMGLLYFGIVLITMPGCIMGMVSNWDVLQFILVRTLFVVAFIVIVAIQTRQKRLI